MYHSALTSGGKTCQSETDTAFTENRWHLIKCKPLVGDSSVITEMLIINYPQECNVWWYVMRISGLRLVWFQIVSAIRETNSETVGFREFLARQFDV